ncbi:DNA polymerase III subunit gamma/tau [Pediococcus pentosaceus]|uniref:DNA polymerase III subunit gamma/tau n=1 Tax=Pediococcus pentosaceus TaxID=1255 RepID=UPI0003C33AAC|nr:DNA polymerase III subunit gamma/tau [Pediococcus pentosaceus]AHA05545.1 DNA polymerase III subunit gamma/tau [Pediococcus pentosaceus SL4]KAF0522381.1 DNA polymerase III subunit gamma/tau [Pediococcus pentosaceus]
MSYQALYRVWRPQKFDDMVGQDVVTRTLKNALITEQTSHAYLFTGPRGTGKTSAAKIFAKAVNCHYLKDGEPCNECVTCKAITEGTLNDVIEIDAASNNGVEEIRDIRDKAKYAPTEADYKVYIVDEVHMLSTGAFNALLKTLEEPPANVIFILATTEPQKIPLTIISRTQRFDFKRITPAQSYDRMVYILDQKGIQYDQKALAIIAKAAEGGMRDALSILDQVISFGNEEVTLDNALLVTGSVNQKLLDQYLTQIFKQETSAALETLHQILDEGKDGQRLIEDLIAVQRNLLLYQEDPQLVQEQSLNDLSEAFTEEAAMVTGVELYQMIDTLNSIQQQMRFTTHPDVYLEVLTIKLSQRKTAKVSTEAPTGSVDNQEVEQLRSEVSQLKQAIQKLQQNVKNTPSNSQSAQPKPKKKAVGAKQVKTPANLTKIYPILENATKASLNTMQELWRDLMDMLSVTERALMHVSKPVAASKEGVVVAFNYDFLFEKAVDNEVLRTELQQNLAKLTGSDFKVVYVTVEEWPEVRSGFLNTHHFDKNLEKSEPEASEQSTPKADEDNQAVKKAVELFGSENVNIKND